MTNDTNRSETTLTPDEAFAVLGSETRMKILHALGSVAGFKQTDESLSFSELRDRVGMRDPGQFNYHLNKLTDHFIRKTDDGYTLRQSGRRVVEAVLSGAVTEVPDFDSTPLDWPCPYCGAPIEMSYDDTMPYPVQPYCTQCAGFSDHFDAFESGQIATLRLSPAGIHGRNPRTLLEAAIAWTHLEYLAAFSGICPHCTGIVEHSVSVCETHDFGDRVCPECNRPYASQHYSYCTNCTFDTKRGHAAGLVIPTTELMAFLTAHGRNPITDPWGPVLENVKEEMLSVDPFEARYTFSIDNDTLSLTVDDELNVVEITGSTGPELNS